MSSSPEPPASISRQPHDQQVLFQSEGISMISLSTFAALAVVVIGGAAVSLQDERLCVDHAQQAIAKSGATSRANS